MRMERRTEPRPQVTCTDNFLKFGHAVFKICEQTDRLQIHWLHVSPTYRGKAKTDKLHTKCSFTKTEDERWCCNSDLFMFL